MIVPSCTFVLRINVHYSDIRIPPLPIICISMCVCMCAHVCVGRGKTKILCVMLVIYNIFSNHNLDTTSLIFVTINHSSYSNL